VAALFGLFLASASSQAPGSSAMTTPSDPKEPTIAYGVYDPQERFSGSDRIAIEHVFVQWGAYHRDKLGAALNYAIARNRWLMVTVEPWSDPADRDRGGATLFEDIIHGQYDTNLSAVCADLGTLAVPIFVRWGHEMEDPTGRYPWARDDAEGYIRAYRYVVEHCRPLAPHSLFVWSPKGKPWMSRYYPGAAYTDYVGVSLYGLQGWDLDHVGRPVYFAEKFQDIYSVASRFEKPMMIAELGVAGDQPYRRVWMDELARALHQFPLLRVAAYFNAKDPESWPGRYGAPDWRIDPSVFPPP
jgi:endoglucanase